MMTPSLIDIDTLTKKLPADSIIVDCRFSLADHNAGRAAYDKGHIPGAVHWDMETDLAGAKTGSNGRHPLPSREDFQSLLQRSGINPGTTIVLYDDNRFAGAARAWWLLAFYSVGPVWLLNGGLQAWQDSGQALSQDNPLNASGSIRLPSPDSALIVTMAQVREQLGQQWLIDSREQERFQGLAEPIDPVAGRLPGANNLPWQSATDETGRFLSKDKQLERWQALGAAEADTPPIIYCGSGITASVNALSYVLAGLGTPRLYPGSFSEWCAQPENPLENDRENG